MYVPLDPMKESNRQVTIMEKLLQIVPVIEANTNLEEKLKEIRQKERDKDIKNLDKDFDKINTIEEFLAMRQKYIQSKQEPGAEPDEKKRIQELEDEYYESLVEQIAKNMERRLEHQAILERNNSMIRELRERALHIELRQK